MRIGVLDGIVKRVGLLVLGDAVTDLWQAITLAEREGTLDRWHFPPPITRRVFIAPDLHYPYHRRDVVEHIVDLARGADTIIQIGDAVDGYPISNFDRNPLRRDTIYDEAKAYHLGFWRPIRATNPTARLIQIEGNHEQRLQRYIWKRAPELAGNPDLTWRRLMRLDDYNVEWHPRSGLLVAGLRIKHGDVALKGAGLSARREMEDHRWSGVSAHTHRYGVARRTDKEGVTTEWREIGHACDIAQVEYGDAFDWNLSAGLSITIYDDGRIEYEEHRLS
jgi:hypothetical protein